MSARRQKPIGFAAEGLRLELSVDRNCGIRVHAEVLEVFRIFFSSPLDFHSPDVFYWDVRGAGRIFDRLCADYLKP